MVLELNISHSVGLFSATFLIFNAVIGTGWVVVNLWNRQWTWTDRLCNRIYATPSNILRSSGSVGVSLIMWLVGALIAACGTMVYIELGTVCLFFCWIQYLDLAHISIKGLPRSGGEKNYLEYIYRRPKFMVTCIFTVYALIMASRLGPSIRWFYCNIHLSLTGKLDVK